MKKKIILLVAIVAAVVLIATGVITAVALHSGYLDSLKDYDVNAGAGRFYNGVEILEEDGLYYLTRDGKKISKTGYPLLISVNDSIDDDAEELVTYDDFELYDWYIARNPENTAWLFVNGEGEEVKIAGENLDLFRVSLPYVAFYDTVTYEYGFVSLKALSAGEEISVDMYNYIEMENSVNEGAQYDYAWVKSLGNGTDDAKYIYFDENGDKIFESPIEEAIEYDIYDEDKDLTTRYFKTSLKELYNIKGELVAKDVTVASVNNSKEIMVVLCEPTDDKLSEAENKDNAYGMIISIGTTFKISNKDYDIYQSDAEGSLLLVKTRNAEGTATNEAVLFNMLTGTSISCKNGISTVGSDIVVVANDDKSMYTYIDVETGATLLTSKYDDMSLYGKTGALYSAKEYAELTNGITDPLLKPKAYLHVVSATHAEAVLTLDAKSTVDVLLDYKASPVYVITTVTDVSDVTEPYSLTKKALYIPFSNSNSLTGDYDSVQYLDVFADGVGVAIGTDYESGKFDFIDVATGAIVKTVSAQGAEMAKTAFKHYGTYTLRKDNTVKESTAEYAVIVTYKSDDMGQIASTEWTVLGRNTPMTDDDKLATSALCAVELGNNSLLEHKAVEVYDGHLVFHNTMRQSTVYTLNDDYSLSVLTNIPYNVYSVEYFDDADISKVYIVVMDEYGTIGLYTSDGKQILAPVYDRIKVVDEEYFIVYDHMAGGAFKYNVKKNKVKQIIDFAYDSVYYVGDGGFLVEQSGEWYLFDESKQVKSKALSGDFDDGFFENWTVNAETGKLEIYDCFVCNIDGQLYIHRGETAREAVREDWYNYGVIYKNDYRYEGDGCMPDEYLASIADAGVKVVNFRNTDGSLIETKVVYPTVKGAIDFKMNDTSAVWYSTPTKDLQSTATVVTETAIETCTVNKIYNVYKSHEATDTKA